MAPSSFSFLPLQWIAGSLAGDKLVDFSILKALVSSSPDFLDGAPEAVRERVALRCMEECVDGGGGEVGLGSMDASRSCEAVLLDLMRKVAGSGSLEKDKIQLLNHDIQKFICSKNATLPKPSLELLKEQILKSICPALFSSKEYGGTTGNDRDHLQLDISSAHEKGNKLDKESSAVVTNVMDTRTLHKDPSQSTVRLFPQRISDGKRCNDSQKNIVGDCGATIQLLEKNSINEGMNVQAAAAASNSCHAIPQGSSIRPDCSPEQNAMVQEPCGGKSPPNSIGDNGAKKLNQSLNDRVSTPSLEKNPIHEGSAAQTTGALASGSCNIALQVNMSKDNHLPEQNITEITTMPQQTCGIRPHPSSHQNNSGEKVNEKLYDADVSNQLEKNPICEGLNMQTVAAPASGSCNVALQGSISGANQLNEQNIAKNTTTVQQPCDSRSLPSSPRDNGGKKVKRTLDEKDQATIVPETSSEHSSDDILNESAAARGCTEQDLCVKCGKGGLLLNCNGSGCMLATHESCLGSFVEFDEAGQFYCPFCSYTRAATAYFKAKKKYLRAQKRLSAFIGKETIQRHCIEQSGGDQPKAANNVSPYLNQSNSADVQHDHRVEADDLLDEGEEPVRQIKKQKTNTRSCHSANTGEENIGKTVDRDGSAVHSSEVMRTNGGTVLQKTSEQVQLAEHMQPAENLEPRGETDHGNSSHETRHPLHDRCNASVAQQEVETNEADACSNSQQSRSSKAFEAASSDGTGKRASPRLHSKRNRKSRIQETDADINNPEAFGHQNRHKPSPSKKRKYAYPPKRYTNPVVPSGRRTKLPWTEEEEETLREAMQKFAPQGDGPIPWTQILEYGREVFHKTRLPADLRVKWRNMRKKEGL